MDADVVSARPFRNIGLSKAAQTHRLRKLRTPSKCRECDSYVYFQGAECEEVGPSSQLNPEPSDCQVTAIFSSLAVLPGLSQALSGDSGHPVRPQEAAGSPPAVRQGFLSGGQLCQRRHPVHHHQVHHRDRETGAQDEGEKVGLRLWVILRFTEAFKETCCLPAGHLQGQRGQDPCGEAVSGFRKRKGAGGAVSVFAT